MRLSLHTCFNGIYAILYIYIIRAVKKKSSVILSSNLPLIPFFNIYIFWFSILVLFFYLCMMKSPEAPPIAPATIVYQKKTYTRVYIKRYFLKVNRFCPMVVKKKRHRMDNPWIHYIYISYMRMLLLIMLLLLLFLHQNKVESLGLHLTQKRIF